MDVVNNVPSTSVAVTAISEPGAGSDNNAMTCVTVKQPDGTYLLNGQKTWVTIGHLAVYTILVAKDEDPSYENDKYSLWMIPNDIEGYTFGAWKKSASRLFHLWTASSTMWFSPKTCALASLVKVGRT